MKRFISMLIVLSIAISVFSVNVVAEDSGLMIENDISWSLTTLDGQTITNETYKGKVVMLMFYWGAYCSIATGNVKAVCESNFLNDDRIVVIAVAAGSQGNQYGANTRENVQYFRSNAASHCDKIIFTYDDDDRGRSLMWNYVRKTTGGSSLSAGTFNVIIDSNNMIRYAWQNDRYIFPDYFLELGITTPGDLNNDGNVNINDAIELLKYIAKLDNNVVNEAGTDINGDGVVNINDAIALLKQIAGLN